jgi:hypothetical protein
LPITTHGRRNAFIAATATAATALTLAGAGPASAAPGPGPAGPQPFVLGATDGTCDWNTGQDSVTVTVTWNPASPTWNYVGVYYQEKAPGTRANLGDVSHAVPVGSTWIGPGAPPRTFTFEAPVLPQGYYMEVDGVDLAPNDGWYNDISGVPMANLCIALGTFRLRGVQAVHTF